MKNFILVIAAATGLAACSSAQGYVPAKLTPADQATHKQGLMRALKDPSSAEVDDIRVYQSPNGHRLICSKVNGRNSFGAYSGFQVFMVQKTAGADYSKSYIKPLTVLGGVAAIDCAGAGYPV